MRKLFAFCSIISGVLTFAAAAVVFKEGSTVNAAYACIPALICLMTAIAGDHSDEQYLDIDEPEQDVTAV